MYDARIKSPTADIDIQRQIDGKKCYRFGCHKPATELYQDKLAVSYHEPVCEEHQFHKNDE